MDLCSRRQAGGEKAPLVKSAAPRRGRRGFLLKGTVMLLLLWGLFSFPVMWFIRGEVPEGTDVVWPFVLFAGILLVSAVHKLDEWERAIVLRLGRFHKVKGPGLFVLIPLADRLAQTVDLRIRVTDFSAQETLTGDSVTVTVDALCFWLVWDPEKAILEVENYEDAVILSAKTALRNSVSSHDLSTFLEHGEVIQKQIQEEVDRKTTEWGITIQHIEITD
ncbi:MAG: hypothetical protein LBF63_01700, partial [Treponema sp.]|nr:hypothetical protein [Treponema sp.]